MSGWSLIRSDSEHGGQVNIWAVGDEEATEGLRKLYDNKELHSPNTRVVPKLMPPIYFHGNYTRYKEHNNTI